MAEQSGFFDAHIVDGEYDRVYLAANFAKYFASFIGNGVFGGKSNELMVKQKDIADMSIKVLSGQAWINGYWYENSDELSLNIDVADGTLNRIDLIVLRWSNFNRAINVVIKKGVSASKPTAPALQRDSDFFELELAQIYIRAGATKIAQVDITDTRLNAELCGLVQGVVQQFDTTEFGRQIDSFIENFEASNEAKMREVIAKLEGIIDTNVGASLTLEVEKLKKIAIEDDVETGCFYRINEETKIKEWINPPSIPGVEYCTTQRWNDKPVYQKTFYAASLPNNSTMAIEVDSYCSAVISIDGFAIDSGNNLFYPFPVIVSGSAISIAVINEFEGDGGEGGIIVVKTTGEVSHLQAYITIKYTKA